MHMTDLCKEMEQLGKGIGSVPRYRILEVLISGAKTVSELVAFVQMSQPAVSQHLKTLKETGLVSDERKGQHVYYSVNAAYILRLLTALSKDVKRCKGRTNVMY
jgi:DNA-binding transcriptional ArsR family regulator